jgi:hypothetical protein
MDLYHNTPKFVDREFYILKVRNMVTVQKIEIMSGKFKGLVN